MIDLPTVWFALVAVLLTGYAVLDGFDLGAGMLHLVVARDGRDRRAVLASIAPVWDGNEVWLLTAGGALFAAFPRVYATAFSGFYLALVLVLLALIFRAVSLEVRDRGGAAWARTWDVVFAVSSTVAALLFGVAVGNVMLGVPIEADGTYRGGLFGLLRPFALLVGILSLAMFAMQGAAWLTLKTKGPLRDRSRAAATWAALVFVAVWVVATGAAFALDLGGAHGSGPLAFGTGAILPLAALASVWARSRGRDGWAFVGTAAAIAAAMALAALSLYPDLLPATDPSRSLSVTNAASSDLTLTVMLVIALIGMPLVLAYTAFVYVRFRGVASAAYD